MYRKCDYYKNGFEMLRVNVFRNADDKEPVLSVAVHYDYHGVQAFVATPRSLSCSIALINDEMYRLWNFIQEKNWRGRYKDYDLIVGGQL